MRMMKMAFVIGLGMVATRNLMIHLLATTKTSLLLNGTIDTVTIVGQTFFFVLLFFWPRQFY
jgi:hypothetical protein